LGLDLLYKYHKELVDDNICLIYQGEFNDDITERILFLSDNNINNSAELKRIRKKLSFVMVESFQNIIRHAPSTSVEIKDSENPSVFFVRNLGHVFYVTSVNVIANEKVEILKGRLKHINSLDKDALKELFLDILSDENISDKGGAGLGLIEMARKSGNNIAFDFDEISDEHSYCYLMFKIKHPDEILNNEKKQIPINSIKNFHTDIRKENILLIYKGDFSQETIMPVINMIETNLQASNNINKQRKTFNVMVEVLQNVSRHSFKKDDNNTYGLFMIGYENGKTLIYAGNIISNEKVELLDQQLNKLSNKTDDELNVLYRKTLREGPLENSGGAGLGLIDIARDSNSQFYFSFKKVDNDKSFYSICVKV